MVYFWSATILAGLILQLLVIAALVKGPYRNYKFLFVYCVVLFLTTVTDASAYFTPGMWTRTSKNYWIADAIRQALLFCVVISLTYRGMGANPSRKKIRRALIAGAVVFAALSLVFTSGGLFGAWMTRLARNLGFCAVILNLVLWAVLIKERHPDRRLLLISGGLGIQMAGKAVGHSLRQIAQSTRLAGKYDPGNMIIVLSHLFCLYIWWQALRSAPQE